MFLTDFHIHSTCSPDAHDTMADMAAAAWARGVSDLCFTDHSDFDLPHTMQFDPLRCAAPERQTQQYRAALERAPRGQRIGLGLELGEANHQPERALAIYALPDYDFILGSLHNLRATPDFYYLRYRSEAQCLELYDRYLDELLELSRLNCFDVMAHVGYFVRYSSKQGLDVRLTPERHGEKLTELFRSLIERGKGIELNCADLVPGGREAPLLTTIPTVPVLRLYRALGGEIITVGSDAHDVNAAGVGVAEGLEVLRQNGFRYVTVYRKHKPEFIRL